MCNKELLVAYAYDEVSDAERASFEAHLGACADCRDEVDGLRQLRSTLSAWAPPRPELAFRIVDRAEEARPTRAWWTPAAGLAAAAVLVLAAASALAHVEVRYGADGMSVRTGWDHAIAQPVVAPAPTTDAAAVAENRRLETEFAAMARRIQDLEAAAHTAPTVRTVSAANTGMSDAEMLRRVHDLLAQSESRQQQELALRIAQVIRDVDVQRTADLARIQQGIGRIDAMTTAEAAAHRDLGEIHRDLVETEIGEGVIVKRTWIVALGSVLAASAAAAQPPSAPAAPAPAAPAVQATAPTPTPVSPEVRQQRVRMMEGVLTVAVRNGAETLARQLQISEPGSLVVAGTAHARGFALEGYGVFFDVDVPPMKQSVAWSTMMLVREARRQQLHQLLASAGLDSATRRQAEVELRRLEAPANVESAVPTTVADGSPAPGTVNAQVANEAPNIEQQDPNQLYTEAVKTAIIDAMLNFSGSMDLAPDEWLTVAARDSEGLLIPGAVDDASTIVLSVKGRDIAAFQAKQITLEEARKRVQLREF